MPILVEIEPGVEAEFPDDWSEDQISEALTGFQPRKSEVQSSQESGNQQAFIPDYAQSSQELEQRNLQAQDLIQQQFPGYQQQGQQSGEFQGIPFSELLPKGGIGVRDLVRNRMPIGIGLPSYPQPSEEQIKRLEQNPLMQAKVGAAQGVAELGAGIGQYVTSEHGIREVITSRTPLAPAVLFKWAKDMVEGGMVSTAEAIEAYKRKDWKELARLVTNATGMFAGGAHASKSGVKRVRPVVEEGIQAIQELTPAGKLSKVERLEAEAWLSEHAKLTEQISQLESDPATASDPARQKRLSGLKKTQEVRGLSEPHQKAIDEQAKDSPLPVEVVWGKKAKPGQYSGVRRGADGKPEAIEFYGELVPEYIQNVAKKKRGAAIERTIDEEAIHSRTKPEDADLAASSAGKLERWMVQKNYGRKVGEAGFTERDLGYEIIRQRIQRMSGGTREAVEASFEDKLNIRAMEVMSDAVRAIGEKLGRGSKARGAVDNTLKNIEAAKEAYKAENPDPDWSVTGGEMEGGPAAIFKSPKDWEGHFKSFREVPIEQFGAKLKESPSGLLTPEAWRMGLGVTKPEHVSELQQARQESIRMGKEAQASGDIDKALVHMTRGQFFREAYEAATGTGSAGEALKDFPGYKPPFPESEAGPAAVSKFAREVEKETGFTLVDKQQTEGATKMLTPDEMAAQTPEIRKLYEQIYSQQKPGLEFTDTRPGSPTAGFTFRAPRDATKAEILESYKKVVPQEGPAAINKSQSDFNRDAERFRSANSLPASFGDDLAKHLAGGPASADIKQFLKEHPEYEKFDRGGPAAIDKSQKEVEELQVQEGWDLIGSFRSEVDAQNALIRESKAQGFQPVRGPGIQQLVVFNTELKKYQSLSRQGEIGIGGGENTGNTYKNTYNNPVDSFPAAMSKKAQATARDRAKLLALRQAADEGREAPKMEAPVSQPERDPVPQADRVGATESGAMPRISGADLERTVKEQLAAPISRGEAPSFDSFTKWAARNLEGVKPNQLRDMWQDAVWIELLRAPGERLGQWRKALNLESKYGTRDIPEPPDIRRPEAQAKTMSVQEAWESLEGWPGVPKPVAERPTLPQPTRFTVDEAAAHRRAARYRTKLVEAIGLKLIKDSISERPELDRATVTIDDIDFGNTKTQAGPYRELGRDEISDPQVLNRILRDQARASSADPESASRRLVAVVDKNGEVHLLSTYQDAGVIREEIYSPEGQRRVVSHQGIQRVTDPTGPRTKGRPHRELNQAFLRQYRPFATVLLENPVQGFHQRFGSVTEFMDKIGKDAIDRSRVGEFPGEGAAEDFEAEGTAGLEGEGGLVMGPTARGVRAEMGIGRGALESTSPMTDREAGSILEHVLDEVGDFTGAADVRESLAGLADRAARKQLKPTDWIALSGFNKAFKALEERNPDLGREDVIDRMADTIYENFATTDPARPEAFVAKTMAAFAPEGGAPVRPVPTGQAQATGRELTTPRYRKPIPGAGGPPLRGVTGQAAQTTRAEAEARSGQRAESITQEVQAAPQEPSLGQRAMSRSSELREQAFAEAKSELAQEGESPAAFFKRKKLGPTVTDLIRNTGSVYDEWMVDRIGRVGGDKSKEFSDQARAITDRSKELYGSLTPTLDPARKAAGEMGRATAWLHGKENVTPFAATRRIVDVMEGNIPIPPEAQRTVDLAKAANLEIGRMLQPVAPGFVATGKFARNITVYAYDIIRQGPGDVKNKTEAWFKWTAGIARANRMPISDVRQFFRDWKETLDKPGVDVATIEQVNQDFARKYPNVITDIKVRGVWQPVVHADLFNYLENSAQRAAHIRAFREVYPNNKAGKDALEQTMTDVRREMGEMHQADLEALVRTLQGHPTSSYTEWGMFSPVRPVGQAFRIFNQTVGNLLARGVLTGQMFVQPGENIAGRTPQLLGYKNYLRGLAKVKQLYPELEQMGAVNRIMYDWSFDPNAKIRSIFRIGGNVISKASAQLVMNELQEAHAAATAHVVAERIKAGTLSDWENRMLPQTFKEMGFDQQEVSAMMMGEPKLLDQFQRKAAAFMTSGNKTISESSRWGANRLFNSILRFQTYPMMKVQQLRRVMSNTVEAWDSGTAEQKRASTESLVRFMLGTTLQGALTVGITSLFYQGKQGLQIRMEEAKDDPLIFLAESWFAAMGGPLYIVWKGARDKGIFGVGEQAARVVFPYAVVREMTDMASSTGQYRDQDAFDRIGRFIKQRLPGTKAIRTGLALSGLSMENKKLDASISAFYRWKMSQFRDQGNFEPEPSEFRTHMRRAVEALKRGDADKFNDAYLAAHGASKEVTNEKKQQAIAKSFAQRKILKGPGNRQLTPEEKEALQNHIGFSAYDQIEFFDLMLDEAADGVVLPRKN